MRYAEYLPPPELAPYVRCAWVFESEGGEAPERIVPDGRPEFVVHFRAPYSEAAADGSWQPQPPALIAGQLTRPLQLRSTGPAGVVGIRFHPDGARAFTGHAMQRITDQRVSLDAWCVGSAEVLSRELAKLPDDESRVGVAGRFVMSRIQAVGFPGDALVRRCVALMEEQQAGATVEELTARESLGRRQIERRFADSVGIGPALLASILRFRTVFDVIEHDSSRPWTEAALAAGYYDQSHFIREFRRFVGCTPSEFFRASEGLASALVER